jgi:FMN-dependent NADH-azoreductase
VTDVQFVRAEGIAMGDAAKALALSAADLIIRSLSAAPANQPEEALAA